MTQLSDHFTLEELTRSDTADKIGDANAPTPEHRTNLVVTAHGLEEVREIVGGPIIVHSGYRNRRVNKAVGGVPTSAHAKGFAADIERPGMHPRVLAQRLAGSSLKFDQLIYEASRGVVHISFDPRMRRQVLTQAKGPGTPVTVGIADI